MQIYINYLKGGGKVEKVGWWERLERWEKGRKGGMVGKVGKVGWWERWDGGIAAFSSFQPFHHSIIPSINLSTYK